MSLRPTTGAALPRILQRMSIGTSMFIIGLGAILRYAVDERVAGLELHTAGVILMVFGLAGLVLGLLVGLGRSSGVPPRPEGR